MSNTAGARSCDAQGKWAAEVEAATGVPVLAHGTKKPGCGAEIMDYFRRHPEAGVAGPHQIAVVGDRLLTDMMLANGMGSWGVWVRDGVVPLRQKSFVSCHCLNRGACVLKTLHSHVDIAVFKIGAENGTVPPGTRVRGSSADERIRVTSSMNDGLLQTALSLPDPHSQAGPR